MENNTQVANVQQKQANPVKSLLEREDVKAKFRELLGKKSTGFITSVMSVVMNNEYLKNADPNTIYMAAMMAASLDLPINQNLGFAYIVPYKNQAQFQMGYKGFIQLAQRSGLFKTISATPIYEGQLVAENPLTGFEFDFTKKASDKVVGYASYFSLLNGFEKTFYMTKEDCEKHGKKFSANFKKYGTGLWKDDFDGMAIKTVIKLLLSKYAPLSIEMQRAIITDQSIIKDAETVDVDYVDATNGNVAEVIEIEHLQALYNEKKKHLTEDEIANAERILGNNEENSFKKLQDFLATK